MRLKISLVIFIITFFFFRASALQAGVIPGGWEEVDSKTGSSASRMFVGITDVLPEWDQLLLIKDTDMSPAENKDRNQLRLLLEADQLEVRDEYKRIASEVESEVQPTILRTQRYAPNQVNRAQRDATAQAFPVELVFGYGYLRPEGGQGNLQGWHLSVAGNLNNWFGLVGEFSGQYGSQTLSVAGPSGETIDVESDATFYSFGFGPRFTYRKPKTISPFAHALFGISRGKWVGPGSVSGAETSFGLAMGGGFDVRLAERFGLRILQAEYVQTRFGEDIENHFRIAAGLTVHIGSSLEH